MIVLCRSMISKRFADYQSADSRMQQARWKNKKREDFVYALYSLMFDYAFVHAHDLIRTTWCRRIWIHALQPDRTMKQEIHLWNTALAPDASHHAHDPIRTTWCRRMWIHALQPDRTMKQEIHLWNTALAPGAWHHAHDLMRTTWCRWFFDCILHGCRRLISLQNMAHATIYLLVDIRCVRMYDSLRIISCTLVHPHDILCVRRVRSWAYKHTTSYLYGVRKTWWWSSHESNHCFKKSGS